MLKRFFAFISLFFLQKEVLAQCHQPQFQFSQNPSCGLVQIQNQTTGSVKQEWDFSTGDLGNNPTRVPGFYLLDGRGLNIVKDENTGNYHGFTLSGTNGLVRLDFGSSLMNTPTATTLGTFGLISGSTFSRLALAYDGTNWFGYLGNANNRILIFNFGSNLTNVPVVTNSPVLTGVTNSRNVEVIYYKGLWYVIVTNFNNTFVVFHTGSNLSATLTHVTTYTFSNASAQITGIRSIVDCDTLRVLGCYGPPAAASIFKVDFPNNFSTPVVNVSTITTSGIWPSAYDITYDAGQFIGFTALQNAGWRKHVYADKALNGPNTSNMPALTGMTDIHGLKLIKENSTWHAFFVDRTTDSLVHFVFPELNSATASISTNFNPPTYSYTTQGTKTVDLMSFYSPFNFSFYSDSITILPIPNADFNFYVNCSGLMQFTSSSTIVGGTITQYEWDFGDGNTSTMTNPLHAYNTSGNYNVQLIVTSNLGCKDTIVKSISYTKTSAPQFQFLNNPSCGLVQIQNLTTGSVKQEWDFSTGDLGNNPTRVPGFYLLDGRGLNIVKDENTGNYYGFTLSSTVGLVRLDFGNSLMNMPTATTLGTFSLISNTTFSNFAVAYDGTNWYGYLGNANKKVLIFNFGSNLTNVPTVTNSPDLTGVTNSRNVEVIYYKGLWYVIVANANNIFAIFQTGSNLSATLTHVTTYNLTNATATINGLKVSVDCDTLRVLGCTGPSASASIFKVDFPNNFSTPPETISSIGSGATPLNYDMGYDKNQWIAFVHFQSASWRKVVYSDKALNSFTTSNMPALTGFTDLRGIKLIKENSTWHAFFVDRTTDSLVHLIFPETNSATLSFSTNFNPPSYSYTTQGTKTVDLMSFYNPFNFSFYSDSITILPIPNADFNFSNACVGQTVQFTSTSTLSNGSITQYEWDFGDGNTSTLQNPTHLYSASGSYNVQLIVTSDQNCKDTITKTVFYSPGPSPNFSINIGCQNSVTQFTNSSTSPIQDPITNYFWDFGDGNTSLQANPTHVYTSSGNFTVKLKVTTQNGCTDSTTQNIVVPISPSANFTFSQVCLGSPTVFTDLSTGNIASVFWDMGDGNTFNASVTSYTFANPGSYNVKLVVYGTNGCADSIIKLVKIVDIQSLNITAPSNECQFTPINFQGSATVNGDVIHQWIWDFGNGDSAFVQNPTYTYQQSGNFVVKLTIHAGLDCYQTVQQTIQIQPGPQVNFTANTVCLGNATAFVDGTSYPPGETEAFRRWYFGDGDSSDVLNPTHVYANPGTYNVKLVVESNTGCRNEITKPIFVAPLPHAAALTYVGCLGDSTYFYDNSTILPIDSIVSWQWNIQGYGSFTSKNVAILSIANGDIPFELIVTSSSGCKDTLYDTLFIQGADFQFTQNPVCAFSEVHLQNLSNQVTDFQWDFCLGDLKNRPIRLPDYPLLDARSISIVQDTATKNWYAFTINTDGLVRLDFGNSLENTPTYNVLGTFGITTSMFSRVIVRYDGTKWFGYMGNASTRLITFDFGSSITNIPTSSTTPVLTGVNASRNVEVFRYNGIWYLVVINSNANVAVFSSGSYLSLILTHLQTFTSSNTSAQFTDLKTVVRCGTVDVLLANFHSATSSLNKLTFYQMNQPPVETIFPNNVSAGFGFLGLGYDNEKWNAFIFTLNSAYRRVVFNHDMSQVDTNYVVTNPNLKDIRGAELVKYQSKWYLFLVDRTADSLVTYVFPDTCYANFTHSTDFEPSGLQYSSHGNFPVELSGLSNGIKVYQTRSIQISPSPAIQVNINNLCEKSAVSFDNQTTYVDTSATVNYLWDFGDGNTSTLRSPVHYYDTTGTYTVKLTASVPGLCTSQDSFVITIHPRPVADFQFSTTCANSPVIFTNLSTVQNDSIVFYKWEFGDGTFSLGTNASHQYLIGGTYQVNCIVITSNGCVDTATQTIQVPKVNFTYQNTCLGETVDFQSDLFYPNDNPTGYQWFINNQFVTNQPNFTYNFPNLGTYPVKLIVQTQNGCLDSVIKNIDIIQRPIANFQVVGKTCVNDTVLFVENSSLSNKPIALRIWDFGDGNVDTTTQKQVYYSYNLPGSYNVTLTIVTTTNCTSSVTLPVIVGTSPVVGFTQQNLYCNSQTFTLIDTSTSDPLDPIVSRYWNLGNGMFSINDTLRYHYPDTGQKIISLTVITQSGCSATLYDTLYFQLQPKANFVLPKDTFLTIENVIPTNLCQNAHSFIWLRSDSTAWSSNDTNPVFQFPEPGTYYITLIALHDSGCVDSIQKPVIVVVPVDTIMDIAVLDLQTNVDSTGIMTVAVKIKNKSTVPVYKATMFVRLGQEIANREYYLGNLAPGAIEEYVFKANIVTNPYKKLTYICVNGILPNDLDDVYPDDNVICKSLNDEFYIQNPYPNPTNQTLVIPYILPDNDIVRIQIINELGQIITVLKDDMGQKGLNFLQTDVSNLSSGTYMIVMEFQGKFLMKKFVKY